MKWPVIRYTLCNDRAGSIPVFMLDSYLHIEHTFSSCQWFAYLIHRYANSWKWTSTSFEMHLQGSLQLLLNATPCFHAGIFSRPFCIYNRWVANNLPGNSRKACFRCCRPRWVATTYNKERSVKLDLFRGTKPERILLICHATTMDAAVKTFRKGWVENLSEAHMAHMGTTYPYASVITLVLNNKVGLLKKMTMRCFNSVQQWLREGRAR